MPDILKKIPIYHITHLSNLKSIIEHGIWCDSERIKQKLSSIGIAHDELKQRRLRTNVPVSTLGVLGDYVPFYFCNRSPMLYSIHTGYVEGFNGTQEDIIYLVSSVNRIISEKCSWCFTDGHPVDALTSFFDSTDKLDQVDWPLIGSWKWKNTEEDNDRKRRKQAEFLVKKSLPWHWIDKIGVYNSTQQTKIQAILDNHLPVVIERQWYFDPEKQKNDRNS